MNTPPKLEIFPSGAKENAGIAALCRGFLTKPGEKSTVLARDVNKVLALEHGAMARIFDKARWKKNSFGNCRHMLTAAAPRLSDKA